MSIYERMLSYVPLYYHSSSFYKGILAVEGEELGLLTANLEDLKNQFFVDTATWGLSLWEKEFGLSSGDSLPPDGRRARIKGKIRGMGKVGAELIQSVTEAYSTGDVDVSLDGDIVVTFVGKRGRPTALDQIESQLYEVIPAHLALRFVFTYITWNEIDLLSAWLQESMTWDQLEVYKP